MLSQVYIFQRCKAFTVWCCTQTTHHGQSIPSRQTSPAHLFSCGSIPQDGALILGSWDKFHVTALHLVPLPSTEFTNAPISDFSTLWYKMLICHNNVVFFFYLTLKSCCFCLQGTHHTFHVQKARERVKMSQKMWKNWAKWSENEHNSNENKRWAEPRGEQSITPKKASGAKEPIFGRMLVFYHPLKTPNSKLSFWLFPHHFPTAQV